MLVYMLFLIIKVQVTTTTFFNIFLEPGYQNRLYILDNRPHFEVLGGKYKNNDSNSEEEIWIPVKQKQEKFNIS